MVQTVLLGQALPPTENAPVTVSTALYVTDVLESPRLRSRTLYSVQVSRDLFMYIASPTPSGVVPFPFSSSLQTILPTLGLS